VRTLVVSDLHLGARLGHDVLRHPRALDALLGALDRIERLVFLGDTIELLDARPEDATEIAEPVLREVGSRLGPDREVIIVPGNHDRDLVGSWLDRQEGLPADAAVPEDATPLLERVVSALGPARIRVHYPGVWLSERIWATHGHYLDRHLLPVSSYGIARGLLGRLPGDGATPLDYERAGGPSATRLEAFLIRWLPRPLAALTDDLAEYLRAMTMPGAPGRRLLSNPLARLPVRLLGAQMRRASIPALARVVHRIGVDADWVVFGHVHRCGPLPTDQAERWRGPGGAPRIANTGSWVYEPLLVHHTSPPHPYWPGGAILIEDGADPQPVGLLDHLPADALH
jgi:UDP-2,3-diacylglucosamine pyrophosphatase LpxH